MVNRVLLHGEELEGRIVADGPNCTCRNDDRCPMCGAAQSDAGCAVHDGHELAKTVKDALEADLETRLENEDAGEVLDWLIEHGGDELRGWIEENVTAAMATDDLGQKVPTINITGL